MKYGFLTGTNISIEYIKQSYEQILIELGSSLSRQDFNKILGNGNPFHLPEGIKQDSETLKNTLIHFSELIQKTELDKDVVNEVLMNCLRQLVSEKKTNEAKQKINLETNVFPFEIPYPKELKKPHFTSDGKGLMTMDDQLGIWMSEFGLRFKKVLNSPDSSLNLTQDNFSNDMKYVFAISQKPPLNLYRQKLEGNSIQNHHEWQPELWHSLKHDNIHNFQNLNNLAFSDNGKWIVASMMDSVFVLSAENPEKTMLEPILTINKSEEIRILRFVPKDENIILFSLRNIYFLNLKGEKIKPVLPMKWQNNPFKKLNLPTELFGFFEDQFDLTLDLKKAYAVMNEHGLKEVDLKSGLVKNLKVKIQNLNKLQFHSVKLNKTEKICFILIESLDLNQASRILTYDLQAKKTVKETLLPHQMPRSFHFSPDKSTLVVRYSEANILNFFQTSELLP